MLNLKGAVLGLVVAVTTAVVAAPVVSRPDLVRAWSSIVDAALPLPRPFVCHYSNLFYLASRHANEESSDTVRLMRQVFAERQFGAVIIEGYPAGEGENPASFIRYAERTTHDGFAEGGESAFAALMAVQHHVPFIGGEPPEPDLVRAAIRAGYSERDMLGFYFVRQVPEFVRAHTPHPDNGADVYTQYVRDQGDEAGLQASAAQFSFQDFTQWYLQESGKPFDFDTCSSEETAPQSDSGVFTQRISAIVGLVRDRFVIDTIAKEMNQHGSLLVVFGGSHLTTQGPALDAMLGKPLEVFGPSPR